MMLRSVLQHAVRVEFPSEEPWAARAAIWVIWQKIYELYCCVQILTIPAADFTGLTATSDSAQLQRAAWSGFISTVYRMAVYGVPSQKPQSFEISLSKRLMTSAVLRMSVACEATHESFCLLTNTVQYTILLYISLVSSLYRRTSVFDMNIQYWSYNISKKINQGSGSTSHTLLKQYKEQRITDKHIEHVIFHYCPRAVMKLRWANHSAVKNM